MTPQLICLRRWNSIQRNSLLFHHCPSAGEALKFSEEQIAYALHHVKAGTPVGGAGSVGVGEGVRWKSTRSINTCYRGRCEKTSHARAPRELPGWSQCSKSVMRGRVGWRSSVGRCGSRGIDPRCGHGFARSFKRGPRLVPSHLGAAAPGAALVGHFPAPAASHARQHSGHSTMSPVGAEARK
jgi:hypothetical protein